LNEYNRNDVSFLFQWDQRIGWADKDDIGPCPYKLSCFSHDAFRIIGAPANVEFNIATVDPAQLLQHLLEYSKLGSKIRIIGAAE
jgi:hypothetical protein